MPCNPSAPPVIVVALLASSESMAATTRVCISKVRPVVRRMMAPDKKPTAPAAAPAATSPLIGSPQPLAARIPAV